MTTTERSLTTGELCGDVLMWRANPLARSRIADAAFVDVLRRLVVVEGELSALAPACSDELFAEIGASTGNRRTELMRLRRDIHNGRKPKPCTDLPRRASAWCLLAEQREQLCAEIAETHFAAIGAERDVLLRMLADEDFQRSLALVSPEVYQAALAYRNGFSVTKKETARLRKSERGLLQYLTRAMVRTSPLSRFTAVGLAVSAEQATPITEFDYPGAAALLFFDVAMIRYVASGIGGPDADPLLMHAPTLRVDPDAAKVEFLRSAGNKVQRLSAPLTDPLHALLALAVMGPRRSSVLATELAAQLGTTPDKAATLIESASRVGMLCTANGIDSRLPSLPTELIRTFPDTDQGELTRLAGQLRSLAVLPAAQRKETVARIDEESSLFTRMVNRPAKLTINEDYSGAPSEISLHDSQEALRDLNNTVELLSLFDRMHTVRALASSAFVERFGAGASVSLTEHAEALATTVYRREQSLDLSTAAELGPRDGGLVRLLEMREHASAVMNSGIDRAVEESTEANWTSSELADLTDGLPTRFRCDPLSYAVLVQTYGAELIFNDAYAGNAMLYGRFLAADTAGGGMAATRLATQLRRWYGDGAVEDRGLHGMSINHHQQVLADGLDAQDWYSLRLAHDEESDMLYVADAEGRRIRVLTLGATMPELHPYPLRLANWLVAGGRMIRDFADNWYQGQQRDVMVPRLRAGKVILSRRRWYSAEFDEIARAQGTPDTQRITELARWRARHEVSEQVVLKLPLRAGITNWRAAPRAKPQYVDLSSALGVRTLPRMLARRESGFIEEALPSVDASRHAVEWVVELLRKPGQRFGGASC